MANGPQHISKHADRILAASIASWLLISRREIDGLTRQALEDVMFQRDARINVVEWPLIKGARVVTEKEVKDA